MIPQQDDLEARVLTDEHGIVLRTTRAADQLALVPAARIKPRPIATWFDVADRTQVRRMIGRSSDTQSQVLDQALLRRPDGSTLAVRVLLDRIPGEPGGTPQLRWSLTRYEPAGPHLRLVESPPPAAGPRVGQVGVGQVGVGQVEPRLSDRLMALLALLAQRPSLPEAWSAIVEQGSNLIDGADHVGLVLERRRSTGLPVAGSDPAAAAADLVQLELGGPLRDTLAEHRMHRMSDTTQPSAWPVFAERAAAALGIRAVLTVPLTVPVQRSDTEHGDPGRSSRADRPARTDRHVGVLCLYADTPHALDGAERAASLLAAHVAVALVWLDRESSLQEAMVSRQLIGEAVGILVERRKLTSAAALEVLVRRSQDGNIKLRELARILVETGQDPSEILAL